MSYIRSDGYRMKDPDDDAFAQVIVGDLQRLALNLARGSTTSAYVTQPDVDETVDNAAPVKKFCYAVSAPTGLYPGFPTPTIYGTGTNASELDPYSMYSAVTGLVTFPEAGYVKMRASISGISDTLGYSNIGLAKNGVSLGYDLDYDATNVLSHAVEMIFSVVAGDTAFAWLADDGTVGTIYLGSSLSATYL